MRKKLRLPKEARYRRGMMDKGYADFVNVSGLVGVLVARRLATLHELETVYSYEDALNLTEILTVRNYNEWVAKEDARRA